MFYETLLHLVLCFFSLRVLYSLSLNRVWNETEQTVSHPFSRRKNQKAFIVSLFRYGIAWGTVHYFFQRILTPISPNFGAKQHQIFFSLSPMGRWDAVPTVAAPILHCMRKGEEKDQSMSHICSHRRSFPSPSRRCNDEFFCRCMYATRKATILQLFIF